jgi:hypothetical protein
MHVARLSPRNVAKFNMTANPVRAPFVKVQMASLQAKAMVFAMMHGEITLTAWYLILCLPLVNICFAQLTNLECNLIHAGTRITLAPV